MGNIYFYLRKITNKRINLNKKGDGARFLIHLAF